MANVPIVQGTLVDEGRAVSWQCWEPWCGMIHINSVCVPTTGQSNDGTWPPGIRVEHGRSYFVTLDPIEAS